MAPTKYRGAFNNGFQLSVGIGVLSANLINFGTEKIKRGWGWRVCLAAAAIPSTLLTLGGLFLPETPNNLIQRNNPDKAKSMLQRIRGTSNVETELNDIIEASLSCKEVENISSLRTILKREYRPQLVMDFLIPFFQKVTGINVISFYAPILFRTIGFGESASLLSGVISTGLVGMISTFVSMLIVDKFGRRTLLLFGGVQMLISQVAIGIIMTLELGDHGDVEKGYAYSLIILICVYVVGFGWSWGPLGWLIPSEIFQLEIRSIWQSINVAVNFVFTFIVAQIFLAMLCHFKAGIFFFFGGWVLVMTLFIYLFLPETRNVPIEKMDRVWREHWFWSGVVGGNQGK